MSTPTGVCHCRGGNESWERACAWCREDAVFVDPSAVHGWIRADGFAGEGINGPSGL